MVGKDWTRVLKFHKQKIRSHTRMQMNLSAPVSSQLEDSKASFDLERFSDMYDKRESL